MAIRNARSRPVIPFVRSEWKSMRVPVVQYRSENATPNVDEAFQCRMRNFSGCLTRTNYQDDAIRHAAQDPCIRNRQNGRCVNEDDIKLLFHSGEEVAQPFREQNRAHVVNRRAAWEN